LPCAVASPIPLIAIVMRNKLSAGFAHQRGPGTLVAVSERGDSTFAQESTIVPQLHTLAAQQQRCLTQLREFLSQPPRVQYELDTLLVEEVQRSRIPW